MLQKAIQLWNRFCDKCIGFTRSAKRIATTMVGFVSGTFWRKTVCVGIALLLVLAMAFKMALPLVLQIAALLCTAGVAAVGLLKGKVFDDDQRLTKSVKVGGSCILLGLVFSVVLTKCERDTVDKRNTESQQATAEQLHRAEEQIRIALLSLTKLEEQARQTTTILTNVKNQGILAGKSLDQMHRLMTEFHTVEVNIVFELPITHSNLSGLVKTLDLLDPKLFESSKQFDPHAKNARNIWAGEFLHQDDGERRRVMRVDLGRFFEKHYDFLADVETFEKPGYFFDLLRGRGFTIILTKDDWDPQNERFLNAPFASRFNLASLVATEPDQILNLALLYRPDSRRLFLEWNGILYRKQNWVTDGQVVCLDDLPNCNLYIWLRSETQPGIPVYWSDVLLAARPVWLNLQFDNHPITLTNVVTVSIGGGHNAYRYRLPDATGITQGGHLASSPGNFFSHRDLDTGARRKDSVGQPRSTSDK